MERSTITYTAVSVNKKDDEMEALQKHCDGPIIHDCIDPQYKKIIFSRFIIKVNDNVNNCCLMRDGNIIKIENIAHCKKRKCLVAIGRKYLIKKDLFHIPCPSSLIDVYEVSRMFELCTWLISDIYKKMLIMPYTNNVFIVIPLLHIE